MGTRSIAFPVVFFTLLGSPLGAAEHRCDFDPTAILRLDPSEQCAVRALSETCDDLHHCYAACLVDRRGENVGGGCAHLCGIIERSHRYYDCYSGLRDAMDALATYFAIVNDSDESIRVDLHYAMASNHPPPAISGCLDIDVRLAPPNQLGQDSYLVDDQQRLLVRPVKPTVKGTAARCTASVDIPPRLILLHSASFGYWFTELEQAQIHASSGSYSFSHSDVPRFNPPAESVFRWYVWRHPYPRAP